MGNTAPQTKGFTMAHNQMVKQAIALAHRHLEAEDDQSALFSLICDLTTELAKLYDADREGIPDEERDEYLRETVANTLASVVANICPGYGITDDKIVQYPHYTFMATRTVKTSGVVGGTGRGPIQALFQAKKAVGSYHLGRATEETNLVPLDDSSTQLLA